MSQKWRDAEQRYELYNATMNPEPSPQDYYRHRNEDEMREAEQHEELIETIIEQLVAFWESEEGNEARSLLILSKQCIPIAEDEFEAYALAASGFSHIVGNRTNAYACKHEHVFGTWEYVVKFAWDHGLRSSDEIIQKIRTELDRIADAAPVVET